MSTLCRQSLTGCDPTSAVFCEPLHGGSPDEWVTGLQSWEIASKAAREDGSLGNVSSSGF